MSESFSENDNWEREDAHICPGCAGILNIESCGIYFDKVAYSDFEGMQIFRRMVSRFSEIRGDFQSNYPNLSFAGVQGAEGAYCDAVIANEAQEYSDGYDTVTFEINNRVKTARLSQKKSDRAVGFSNLASSIPVCPNCGFVLPIDFFVRKKIYIGLLGASSSGKTVAISVLARKGYDCLNYTGRFSFSGMYTEADPGYASIYQSIIQDIDQGILPAGTQNYRIPPLLIKMDVALDSSEGQFLIAFIDAAGEAFPTRERIGFLNYCSGYVIAIESQGVYSNTNQNGSGSNDDGLHPYLMSEEEQKKSSQGALEHGRTVIRDIRSSSFARNLMPSAHYSITNPETYVNLLNSIGFEGRRAVAVVMTKADLIPDIDESKPFLLSNGRYRAGEKGRFVFDFDRFGKKNSLVQSILSDKGIVLHIDKSKFETAYFAVSATGSQPVLKSRGEVDRWNRDRKESVYYCESVTPKNLHEPFMWLILNTLKDNGDLK